MKKAQIIFDADDISIEDFKKLSESENLIVMVNEKVKGIKRIDHTYIWLANDADLLTLRKIYSEYRKEELYKVLKDYSNHNYVNENAAIRAKLDELKKLYFQNS